MVYAIAGSEVRFSRRNVNVGLTGRYPKHRLTNDRAHLSRHRHADYPFSPMLHDFKRKYYAGGETGIRTLGTLSRTHAFQACALSRSAISPATRSGQYQTERLAQTRIMHPSSMRRGRRTAESPP